MSSVWNYTTAILEIHRTCTRESYKSAIELIVNFCAVLNSVLLVRASRAARTKITPKDIVFCSVQLASMLAVLLHSIELIFRLRCPPVAAKTTTSHLILALETITEAPMQIVNLLLPVLSIWRFVAVLSPIRSRALFTKKLAVVTVFVVSLVACVWALLTFFYYSNEMSYYSFYDSELTKCYVLPSFTSSEVGTELFDRRNFMIFSTVLNVVPFVVTSAFNVCLIFRIIYENRQEKVLREGQTSPSSKGQCPKMTLAFFLVSVMQVFGFCSPKLSILFVFVYPDRRSIVNEHGCFFFFTFPAFVFGCLLILPVYCLLSKRIRDSYVRYMKNFFGKCFCGKVFHEERNSSQNSRQCIYSKASRLRRDSSVYL